MVKGIADGCMYSSTARPRLAIIAVHMLGGGTNYTPLENFAMSHGMGGGLATDLYLKSQDYSDPMKNHVADVNEAVTSENRVMFPALNSSNSLAINSTPSWAEPSAWDESLLDRLRFRMKCTLVRNLDHCLYWSLSRAYMMYTFVMFFTLTCFPERCTLVNYILRCQLSGILPHALSLVYV